MLIHSQPQETDVAKAIRHVAEFIACRSDDRIEEDV
jgi:hypothetical protein